LIRVDQFEPSSLELPEALELRQTGEDHALQNGQCSAVTTGYRLPFYRHRLPF
jgi:hypothetical protein